MYNLRKELIPTITYSLNASTSSRLFGSAIDHVVYAKLQDTFNTTDLRSQMILTHHQYVEAVDCMLRHHDILEDETDMNKHLLFSQLLKINKFDLLARYMISMGMTTNPTYLDAYFSAIRVRKASYSLDVIYPV